MFFVFFLLRPVGQTGMPRLVRQTALRRTARRAPRAMHRRRTRSHGCERPRRPAPRRRRHPPGSNERWPPCRPQQLDPPTRTGHHRPPAPRWGESLAPQPGGHSGDWASAPARATPCSSKVGGSQESGPNHRRAPPHPAATRRAMRATPSIMSSSANAKEKRAYPGAPKASPGTNATLASDNTRSASSRVVCGV